MTTPITDGLLDDVGIIDCDAHITEPSDLWTSRAPASMRERMPHHRTVDGVTAWFLDGELWASIGGNTIATGREKVLGTHVIQPFEDVDVSSWDTAERLRLMDEQGVEAAILYPNGIGFASNHVFAIEYESQRTAVLQTYNDFYVDMQEESNGRMLGQGILPVWDIDLTVKEMTRLLDKGMRGFTLSDKPEMLGLPELHEPYFEPMWDLFDSSGAVANFHIGSGARKEEMEALRAMRNTPKATFDPGQPRPIPPTPNLSWNGFGPQRTLAVIATQFYMSNVRILINFCMSDMFDRYPNLKIVSAESGIGWVPFILEALEYQLDEMVTSPDERTYQQRRPTEYFRDHFSVMFWFERLAAEKLIEDIGVNNVLVETDVPHPTCLYPGAREHFRSVLGGVAPDVRRRVLHDNAAELYKIA